MPHYNSAEEFADKVLLGQIPNYCAVDLCNRGINETGAEALAEALQSEYSPKILSLDLSSNEIGDIGAQALATALQSEKCPQGFRLSLWNNKIGDIGMQAFAKALQAGKFPQGFKLSLWRNKIGDIGMQAFAKALQAGKCPQGLELDLGSNNIGTIGAQALATALESGKCREGFKLDLGSNNIGTIGAQALATALESGKCREGFKLDLGWNNIGTIGAQALATALQLGKCPQGLELKLWDNKIDDIGMQDLATALQLGKCPQGLELHLSCNKIGDIGAQALATALQSGKCPQGLVLHLSWNKIGDIGMQALATALQSGKCPQGLVLNLSWNKIGDIATKALAQAMATLKASWKIEIRTDTEASEKIDQYRTMFVTIHAVLKFHTEESSEQIKQAHPELSFVEALTKALDNLDRLEEKGFESQYLRAKLYNLYFRYQLEEFSKLSEAEYSNPQISFELDSLFEDFLKIVPILQKDTASAYPSMLAHIFGMIYGRLTRNNSSLSLDHAAKRYHCFLTAIELSATPEDKQLQQTCFNRIIENDEEQQNTTVLFHHAMQNNHRNYANLMIKRGAKVLPQNATREYIQKFGSLDLKVNFAHLITHPLLDKIIQINGFESACAMAMIEDTGSVNALRLYAKSEALRLSRLPWSKKTNVKMTALETAVFGRDEQAPSRLVNALRLHRSKYFTSLYNPSSYNNMPASLHKHKPS